MLSFPTSSKAISDTAWTGVRTLARLGNQYLRIAVWQKARSKSVLPMSPSGRRPIRRQDRRFRPAPRSAPAPRKWTPNSLKCMKMELPVAQVLFEMERNGVQIDHAELARQRELCAELMKQNKKPTPPQATFNLNSPKQLQRNLFDKWASPPKA